MTNGKPKPLPSFELVRRVFDYDLNKGILAYKIKAAKRVNIGDKAGSIGRGGYRVVRVNGQSYFAHRIIWLWVTGSDPAEMSVDHINRVRHDNRWINLRLLNAGNNKANCGPRIDNTSGIKGVYPSRGKWEAQVRYKGRLYCSGRFNTKEEAGIAVRLLRASLYGEYAEHE